MNAQEIKELRNQLGLTQEKFAKRIGVSFMSVNRWEAGATKPSKLAVKAMKVLALEVVA